MDITGKIVQILQEVTGEGKNGSWRKQDFVIETQDEYPKKVCISTWGDKIDLNSMNQDDKVKVHFNLESREYNNRWYTDVRAWKLEKVEQGAPEYGNAPPPPPPPMDMEPDETDDLPF